MERGGNGRERVDEGVGEVGDEKEAGEEEEELVQDRTGGGRDGEKRGFTREGEQDVPKVV